MKKLDCSFAKFWYHLNRKILKRAFSRKLSLALRYLQGRGVPLDIVYDIGARHGNWTKAISRALRKSEFFLFEANDKCRAKLASTGRPFFIGVLSSEIGEVKFFENDSTGDSYYKENTSHYETIQPSLKKTVMLDTVISHSQLPLPDLIKLDTQGSELDILQGGKIALGNASLIYLECPIVAYNNGAPTIQSYISYLGSNGFIPFDVFEIHRSHEVMLQVDILFIRKDIVEKLSPSANQVHNFLNLDVQPR